MSVKPDLRDLFGAVRDDLAGVDAQVRAAAEVDYPLLAAVVNDIVGAGGKRMRPSLMLLLARAFDHDPERVITAAAASELLHIAGLVHDDLIDQADTRRGAPTLNSMFNDGTVILLGDYLFAQAARTAARTGSTRVMDIFGRILAEITDGQLREIFKAHDVEQTIDDYERRIYGKTASLFAGSAEIAAVLCEVPEEQIQAARQYATDLGIAFQIVDDVLDIRETSETLGKPAGSDLRQGTVTLPMLYFIGNGHDPDSVALVRRAIVGGDISEAEYDAAIGELRESDVLRKSLDEAIRYVERAKAALDILPPSEARDTLRALADFAVERHR
ncbi:MAG: Decaprenyl diphosphate synthase [uncultured Thermomicrobiales bacterium]|uniref:Decaprenyl diphosphate synthase n=1 Tax=uncultured Thermomicrobiales bacterium TaxID=1645740 RepID=A0A6J4UW64_9BACT|nr:MAG: Decaprenyl diphosphate synthase [uncultured Thermomicrobiales bacterium]